MDWYQSFDELCEHAVEGRDFRIRTVTRPGQVAVIAPHGGGIEPGTSELAEAIAGTALSFYAFEGTRSNNNRDLHITSTRFREARCEALIATSPLVITLHGEDSDDEAVFIGGLAGELLRAVEESLEAAGFSVERHANPALQGESRENICNRGVRRGGVQLELSSGLRSTFFEGLTRRGRRKTTDRFATFVEAVRNGVPQF
ncbi:MAG TPA: poly-gamma-glutamate hydrolase family protein [Terriglobia bacterium]|nr:poly-gamma-glutamate hydrolase family protein [Terriglobia bacterium]